MPIISQISIPDEKGNLSPPQMRFGQFSPKTPPCVRHCERNEVERGNLIPAGSANGSAQGSRGSHAEAWQA
ncbi:MAG: hypothetical protein MUD08_01920 [Cytophagales bacterium]|nr:hypothetical protein [Cytophagales bacterium]